jgi:hypothetical protein
MHDGEHYSIIDYSIIFMAQGSLCGFRSFIFQLFP